MTYLLSQFFYKLPDYLAYEIHDSVLKGIRFDDWTYMSILCTSSATKLKAISDAYMAVNGVSLNDDINMVGKAGRPVYQKMVDPKVKESSQFLSP
ncbi:uncharacterized protein LOC111052429 [Nilaparvata lugens]|uniref:uncharacterized protein LOC111052429 n=1 Tax=Nilaparvata lugens TaxID=108931 RepID=UPI00193CCCDB|nr:uncharacterized protein LOC111052429 [Nilaparvata lugens]